jgi:hypothetical protein
MQLSFHEVFKLLRLHTFNKFLFENFPLKFNELEISYSYSSCVARQINVVKGLLFPRFLNLLYGYSVTLLIRVISPPQRLCLQSLLSKGSICHSAHVILSMMKVS